MPTLRRRLRETDDAGIALQGAMCSALADPISGENIANSRRPCHPVPDGADLQILWIQPSNAGKKKKYGWSVIGHSRYSQRPEICSGEIPGLRRRLRQRRWR
jgi:hypothetical protein